MYSSAVFTNDMKDFSEPEIQQKPADGLLLQMKAMNIDKVVNFPFPSPPDGVQLRGAEERLQLLRLLTAPAPGLPLREAERLRFTSSVTPLGRAVASFPVSPRFGKMLALSHQHQLLPLAVALVAALSVQARNLYIRKVLISCVNFVYCNGSRSKQRILPLPEWWEHLFILLYLPEISAHISRQ